MTEYLFQIRFRYEDGAEWVIGARVPETNETQALAECKRIISAAVARGKYSRPGVPMSSYVVAEAIEPTEPAIPPIP